MANERTWFITGCSSGFGHSLAHEVLSEGEHVIATARSVERLQDLQKEFPSQVLCLPLDVTEAASVRSAVQQAKDWKGTIDVVVNNAGYGVLGALEELSEEQITENFQTNFFGLVTVTRELLPILRAQRSGHIINFGAIAGFSNYAGFSIYGASKAAVDALSESLALELLPLGVKVTCVIPGPFRTEFAGRSLQISDNKKDEYKRSSGKFADIMKNMEGKQPGNPVKAARAILEVSRLEKPPLRLFLGEYAHKKVREKIEKITQELELYETIGIQTDFALEDDQSFKNTSASSPSL